jgi:hypothetical protein
VQSLYKRRTQIRGRKKRRVNALVRLCRARFDDVKEEHTARLKSYSVRRRARQSVRSINLGALINTLINALIGALKGALMDAPAALRSSGVYLSLQGDTRQASSFKACRLFDLRVSYSWSQYKTVGSVLSNQKLIASWE